MTEAGTNPRTDEQVDPMRRIAAALERIADALEGHGDHRLGIPVDIFQGEFEPPIRVEVVK